MLGIDFGTKRIGLAVTDPLWLGATPLMTIANDGQHWQVIQQVCQEHRVGAVVVGLPLWDRQRTSRLLPLVQQFATALRRKIQLPVVLVDESYTTAHARQVQRERKLQKKTRHAGIDALAAALLLEEVVQMVRV